MDNANIKNTVEKENPKMEVANETHKELRRTFVRGILKGVISGTIIVGGLVSVLSYYFGKTLKSNEETSE